MALKFPDILQHNNSSSYALIDASELRGTTHTITNLNQTGSSIPTDKRNTGTIVFVTSEQKYYGYYGATNSSTDWNTVSNWKQIADGVNSNNLNAITTGSSGTNQTISGSLTVLGGILATASFATSSTSASFAQTSSFVLDGFTSASARLNRLTLFKGNGTTSSITINTGSSGISIPDIIGASSEGQFLYNFLGGGIAGDSSLVLQNGLLTATGSFYGVFYGDGSTDVDFVGTASWAESASFALSVSAITSSYPFNISNNNIFSAGANKLDDIELPINGEHNFFVGDGSAIRSIYTHSISIGYKSGFREQNYVGSQISSYGNIFLGNESGYTINDDDYVKSSMFALYRAGRDTSAENSIFLGREAGIKSKHANNSVFIGTKSGVLQQNASHSIFIGFKAGSTIDYASGDQTDITVLTENSLNSIIKNPLGRNNIIIGTNITLPTDTIDSINIGGVLFGSGTYYNVDGYPLEYPIQNGKIGINKYPTNYNLEVSGTTNITNGLYVTNSINLSGSNNHTGNYILTGSILSTGSNTFVGTTTIIGSLETSGSTVISGNLEIAQNLMVLGSASFYYFSTTFVTTSTIVATGSNSLGDTIDDTQTLVGAVIISGSLTVTGSTFLTASNVVGGQNNYLARWNSNNSLTTSSLYETSSNILIGTTINPNNDFKLYISGNIGLPAYQISSISSSSNPNSIGIWRPAGNSGYTNFLETTTSESKYNFVFRGIDGFGVKRNWEENNSAIVNINLGWGEPTQTLWTASALLIDPHISKSNGNAALIRGIYYNPIVTASANTTLVAIETTTGSIIFQNVPTSSTVKNVVLYDSTSGQLYYTSSVGIETDPIFVSKSGSLATTGSNVFIGTQTITGSLVVSGSGVTVTGSLTVTQNLTVLGTASIQYLNVIYETASVIYSSGSNQFGDATNDVQTLIGTTKLSGSLEVTASTITLNIPSKQNGYVLQSDVNGGATWVNPFGIIAATPTLIATGSVTASVNTAAGVFNMFTIQSGSSTGLTYTNTGLLTLTNASGSSAFPTITANGALRLGTDSANSVLLNTNGNDRWFVSSAGHFLSNQDNTYDIGASGANRVRNIYVAGTGSFEKGLIVTGSALISGSLTVTGSLRVSGSITGSLLGTASFANTATNVTVTNSNAGGSTRYLAFVLSGAGTRGIEINTTRLQYDNTTGTILATASFATTASYALNAGSGGGAGFPFSGSAVITGSLLVSGSGIEVIGNQTITGNLIVSGNITLGDSGSDSITMNAATMSLGSGTGVLNIDSNTLFVDGNNNRIGIGTNSPSRSLHVSGTLFVTNTSTLPSIISDSGIVAAFKQATTIDAITNASSYNPILALHNVTGSAFSYALMTYQHGYDNDSNPVAIARVGTKKTAGDNNTTVGNYRGDYFVQLRNGSALNEVMYISSSGNFGIGTITPAFRLDVSGSGRFTNGLTVSGSLLVSGSNHTITGSLRVRDGITGSLQGTASWANNATNAINATNANFATTAGNGGVTSISSGTGISVNASTGDVQISANPEYDQLLYIFSQTSTNPPGKPSSPGTIVDPIINTITNAAADFSWSYSDVGEYTLTGINDGVGKFDQDFTAIYLTPGTIVAYKNFNCSYEWNNTSQITIYSNVADGTAYDGIFQNATLDIRVYK